MFKVGDRVVYRGKLVAVVASSRAELSGIEYWEDGENYSDIVNNQYLTLLA